jgi:ankyrin repeat protein
MNAVVEGHLELVKYFLSRGANVNSRSRHNSPLGMACSQSRMEFVQVLIDGGADVNLPDQFNQLPLLYCRRVEFVDYLVSRGAYVHFLDLNSRSLLHHAAARRYFKIYKRLLDLKVDSMRTLSNGWKAIDIALKSSGRFSDRLNCQRDLGKEDFLNLEREMIDRLIAEGRSED